MIPAASFLAERVGFEPTVGCPITSFQDWLLKPLGHLSIPVNDTISLGKSQGRKSIAAPFDFSIVIFCGMWYNEPNSQKGGMDYEGESAEEHPMGGGSEQI